MRFCALLREGVSILKLIFGSEWREHDWSGDLFD